MNKENHLNSVEKDFKQLITTYLSGNITPEEERVLNFRLEESPENSKFFEEYCYTWFAASGLAPKNKRKYSNAYSNVTKKLKFIPKKQSITLNYGIKIAAIFLLLTVLGGLVSFYITRSYYQIPNQGICVFEAPIGSRATAILPDGTKVWLNAGSRIEYASDYSYKNRKVVLVGEGFFKVKHDPEHPFLVKTKSVTVKAIGTSFNVKAYPGEKEITTTLVEGKVELKGKGMNNQCFSYLMEPKQTVTYIEDEKLFSTLSNKRSVQEKPKQENTVKSIVPLKTIAPIVTEIDVKTELYTSWKDERWIIESQNISDLAVLLERRFNVSIFIMNEEIKNYRFSGTIQNETIEQIFDIIKLTLPINYTINKGRIVIETDEKNKARYKSAFMND